MKKYIFFVVFSFMFTVAEHNGYAQNTLETNNDEAEISKETFFIDGEEIELPKIILERDFFNFNMGITWHQYKYLDGTLLKYKGVRQIISEVPRNDVVLNKERKWFIMNIVSGFLFIGSFTTWMAYNGLDLNYRDVIAPISLTSSIMSFGMLVGSNAAWRYNMRYAINRYNLFVQNLLVK